MEWISVNDRLPEPDDIILVWNKGFKIAKRRLVGDTTLWHYDGDTLYTYNAPSHWMLPTEPEQSPQSPQE